MVKQLSLTKSLWLPEPQILLLDSNRTSSMLMNGDSPVFLLGNPDNVVCVLGQAIV